MSDIKDIKSMYIDKIKKNKDEACTSCYMYIVKSFIRRIWHNMY